jgi:hypothetical protein
LGECADTAADWVFVDLKFLSRRRFGVTLLCSGNPRFVSIANMPYWRRCLRLPAMGAYAAQRASPKKSSCSIGIRALQARAAQTRIDAPPREGF